MCAHHHYVLERHLNRAGLSPQSMPRGITKMFIAIHRDRSHHGLAKTSMRLRLGNGLLVSLIAALLLLAGLSGTGTTVFTSLNNDHEHSGLSTPSFTDPQVLRNSPARTQADFNTSANARPRWRSDIMDSYESVPSLAALAKHGDKHTGLAHGVAEPRAVSPSGMSW